MTDRGRLRLLDAAGLVAALAWAWLAWRSRGGTGGELLALLGSLGVAWVALAAAVWAVRGATPARRAVVIRIVLWAVVFRIAGLAADPVLEDDWYRYLWDGYRFAETGTPYGQAPLASFDDPGVPPVFDRVLDGINNPDLPTIYGPVPELAFLLAYLAAPASLVALKLLLVAAELGAAWLFLRRRDGVLACLLWLWCPLLIQESAFNAHPEAFGVLALVAALGVTVRAAGRGTDAGLGVLAGLAAGARPFGALMAPFLLSLRRPAQWLAFAATLFLLYLPFVIQGNFGGVSMAAMAGGWEFNSSGYAVLSLLAGPETARMLSALLFGAAYVGLWLAHARRHGETPRGELVLGALFLLSPVVNPWYLLWLLPFAILRPSAWAWTALAAISLSYVHGLGIGDPSMGLYEHPAWLRPLEFGAVAAALVFDVWRAWGAPGRRGRGNTGTHPEGWAPAGNQ